MKVIRNNDIDKIHISDIEYGDTFISKDEVYMLIKIDINIDCPECGEKTNINDDYLAYKDFGVNIKTGQVEIFNDTELAIPCSCEVTVKNE